MASVIYPNGTHLDHEPYSVHKILYGKRPLLKTYHQGKGGVIIAKGNRIEGIEAKE